jgi:hypothetical protein
LSQFLFQPFYDSSKGMMMMQTNLLTQVNAKVFCSVCSAMFRSTGTRQVVDFKGFFTTFSMFVPMFQYIYKGSRIQKTLYNVKWRGVSGWTSLGKGVKNTEQWNRTDNEARNYMISLTFSQLKNTEHGWNMRNNAQKTGNFASTPA